jgi:hypothetical protein
MIGTCTVIERGLRRTQRCRRERKRGMERNKWTRKKEEIKSREREREREDLGEGERRGRSKGNRWRGCGSEELLQSVLVGCNSIYGRKEV